MANGRPCEAKGDSVHTLGSETRFQHKEDTRAVAGTNGMNIMDRSTGKYFALTSTCREIWRLIGERKSIDEILSALQSKYPDAGTRLHDDLHSFLEKLIALELITPANASITSEATAATMVDSKQRTPREDPESASRPHPIRLPSALRRHLGGGRISTASWMVLAYLSLILTDCFLKGCGFARFYQAVRSWPCERVSINRQQSDTDAIVAVVNRAAAYYLKRAWCLQRSAVTTCLLRLRGIPAELVIGVRELPFMAHAWVEVAGEVVNDRAIVQSFYQEIERC